MEARAATLETGIWGQNRGTISGNSQLGRVGITNFLRRGGWSWRPGIAVRLVWYGPGEDGYTRHGGTNMVQTLSGCQGRRITARGGDPKIRLLGASIYQLV